MYAIELSSERKYKILYLNKYTPYINMYNFIMVIALLAYIVIALLFMG